MNIKLLVPIIILVIVYLFFMFRELTATPKTRWFGKVIWGIVICLSIPVGGLIFYFFGKEQQQ